MRKSLFERILDELPEHHDTPSGLVRLFFAERTPANGPGAGLMGVEGRWILDAYSKGIEAACHLFREELKWTDPPRCPDSGFRTDLKGYVPALVHDVDSSLKSPFASAYSSTAGDRSFIGLPSEPWETTRKAVTEKARIIAAHETAHLFTHSLKNMNSIAYDAWGWFDEATAVFVEWTLASKSPERHYFARHWVYSPQRGLEQRFENVSVGYETAWFVAYLVRKHGWEILTDVWHCKGVKSPIEAIDDWFRKRRIAFRDVLHDVKDEFASGYCVESFLTANLCPRLHKRFGNRWPCYTFNPSPGKQDFHVERELEPLACRYYRIRPKNRRSGFRVEVQGSLPPRQSGLKAYVFGVRKNVMIGAPNVLVGDGATTASTILGKTIDPIADASYYVLAVANVNSVIDKLGNPSPPRFGHRPALTNTTSYRVDLSA